jgi:hypothetical protein
MPCKPCANLCDKVVACVRYSTLLPNIRPQKTRQFTSAQQINQFEGLAVAIPCGFESPPSALPIKISNPKTRL